MRAALHARARAVKRIVSGAIADPIFASVGDSRTQFGHEGIQILSGAGWTISRDAAGLVTLAKTGHGINGDQKIFLANTTDASYQVMGDGHWVSADTYTIQTAVTGAAGSTTPAANCFAVKMGCMTGRGVMENLQKRLKGGIKYLGAYAQGGMFASAMGPECDLACATNAQFVLLEGGVNDAKGGSTAAATAAAVNSLIDKITAAGKVAVVLNISLTGTALSGYGTWNDIIIAANALIAAHCNGTTSIFVDTNTGLQDSGTSSPNIAAWNWATTDGVHAHTRAADYEAQQIIAALAGKITTHDLLPVAATTVPYAGAVANTTIVRDYNLWPGYTPTSSGFFTGTTGTRGNNQNVSRLAGSPNTTMSILADPGDGLGAITRLVIQPAATGDRIQFVGNTTSETIAAAGLTVGDYFVAAVEVYNYSNWDASLAGAVWVGATSNNSGTYASGFGGDNNNNLETTAAGLNTFYGDGAGPFYLVSGVMKVASLMDHVSTFVNAHFGGFAAGQALTLDLRRPTLIKVPLGY
jgi:hypothetical protein